MNIKVLRFGSHRAENLSYVIRKTMKKIFYIACTVFAIAACSEEENEETKKDMEKPEIVEGTSFSPIDCQTYQKGEDILFRFRFIDNMELGNYNIEIHNNFDHHSHSTSAGDCNLDPKKQPVDPWVYNQDYSIPPGERLYDANVDIPIPENIDAGDYHFMVRLTDKSGWQQLKAISIKIIE